MDEVVMFISDVLDPLVASFKASNSEFVADYQNARRILGNAGGNNGKAPEPPPVLTAPMGGASAKAA
jgi:hypothetical protein